MTVTISTKDIGDVKDVFDGDYSDGLEEGNERYIKRELRCEDGD